MTVATRYNLFKAGKITKEQFLYEVRKDTSVPFITPLTSFDDAVTMLKQRRIVVENFEAPIAEQSNEDPYMQGFLAAEQGADYQDCPFMQDENPEEYEMWCDGWIDGSDEGTEAEEESSVDDFYDDQINDYEQNIANSEMSRHDSEMYMEAPSLREQVKEFVQKAMEGGSSMDEAKEQAREYFSTEKAALNEALNKDIKVFGQDLEKNLKSAGFDSLITFQAPSSEQENKVAEHANLVILYVRQDQSVQSLELRANIKAAKQIDKILSKFQFSDWNGPKKAFGSGWDAKTKQVLQNFNPGDIVASIDPGTGLSGKSFYDARFYRYANPGTKVKTTTGINEAAKPKLDIDQVNPYELKKGTDYEMGYADKAAPSWSESSLMDIAGDFAKAQAKALKNLNKDPMYYTRLQANGGKKEKKEKEVKVAWDGYQLGKMAEDDKANVTNKKEGPVKTPGVKVMKEGIKTSVQKIREFVSNQLKKETQLVKSKKTGATIDVVSDAQAQQMQADLQKKGVQTTKTTV